MLDKIDKPHPGQDTPKKRFCVTIEALLTIMAEVEKTLNDWPLWSLSNDPNDEQPLSPAHFLSLHSSPSPVFAGTEFSRSWWKQANYSSEIF
ncbi:hypothetical protein CAPTEDRAFT_143088 [Capitella teleta]|uniref:Uncharacterized protein n=1 Tax=Capitella teleta TaxID=283909 RepID=R7TYK5_CAPTE|nr:hypothetical protein CAPTEDRAFT_143088 [Capitella teleta]|eukprot:ELT96511.1 hypothetical protein CAPTEDRAFT_143088 [Capitella teleta]